MEESHQTVVIEKVAQPIEVFIGMPKNLFHIFTSALVKFFLPRSEEMIVVIDGAHRKEMVSCHFKIIITIDRYPALLEFLERTCRDNGIQLKR